MITIRNSAGMTISSGILRHRKRVFSAKTKNKEQSLQRMPKEDSENGEDTIMKYGITTEYFVIKQIH
jgi:hypothetical protein